MKFLLLVVMLLTGCASAGCYTVQYTCKEYGSNSMVNCKSSGRMDVPEYLCKGL